MKQRVLRVGLVLAAALILIVFYLLPQKNQKEMDALSFSSTQEWDPSLYEQLDDELVIVPDAMNRISLPSPPENSSRETKIELEALHAMRAERTPQKVEAIIAEAEIATAPVGTTTYGELTDSETRPFTKYLFETVLQEYNPVILNFKKQFDRVRPSYLDTTLDTAIAVPGHPAYPSGHSSQAHLFAFIMAELDPGGAEIYWSSADEVARNREVAGLHYPSDSKAGVLLAEQFYALLKDTVWYQTALQNAKSEWE